MNAHHARLLRPALGALSIASLAALSSCNGSVCAGFDGCFDGNGLQTIAVSGTAAIGGPALASAAIRVDCVEGSGTTVADGHGNYSVSLAASLPCVITAAAGSTTLHSLAFAGGTFNTTPETELMLVYLAAQLGTDTAHLIANFSSNGHFQHVLENQNDVSGAQSAVVTNLQQRYSVTLTAPLFLTTPFVAGQPGAGADLSALANAGAIDVDGMPNAAAISLLSQAGAANPL